MEHEPSTYKATITLDFQQIMEIRKAITDRVVKYAIATDDDYPHRHDDLETLLRTADILDTLIETACGEWESKVAKDEADLMTDEAIEKWLSDE